MHHFIEDIDYDTKIFQCSAESLPRDGWTFFSRDPCGVPSGGFENRVHRWERYECHAVATFIMMASSISFSNLRRRLSRCNVRYVEFH